MDKWDGITGLTEAVKQELRQMEQQEVAMSWQDESDEVIITEPILPKKDCKVEIVAAESVVWTVKEAAKGGAPGHEGEPYKAMKLTLQITDTEIATEHENARPRLTLEHQFNVDKYPYLEKKSGTVKWMGRQNLYDLEEAFGFEPIFTNGDGKPVEAYVTRTGRKVAPKGEGIKRHFNPAFTAAYFNADGGPNLEWAGKTVYADIAVEKDEQYGDKNRITRFKVAPVTV